MKKPNIALLAFPDPKLGKRKAPKRIRRVSPRQARLNRLYNKIKREWALLPQNQWCRVTQVLKLASQPATKTPHHKRGRHRTLLIDARFFIPVSAWGHTWIHKHPEEARVLGLLAELGSWNKEIGDAETLRLRELMR